MKRPAAAAGDRDLITLKCSSGLLLINIRNVKFKYLFSIQFRIPLETAFEFLRFKNVQKLLLFWNCFSNFDGLLIINWLE